MRADLRPALMNERYVVRDADLLAACEEIYMDGFACQQTGSVDWFAHYYRVDDLVVVTDTQGSKVMYQYASEDLAREDMDWIDAAYCDWLGDDL